MPLLYSLWRLIIFHSVNTHTPHTQCIYTTSSLSIPLVMDISHSLKWGRNFATAALGWSSKWMQVGSKACGKGKRGKTRVRHTSEIWRSSWDNTKSMDMFTFGEHVFFGFLNMEAFKQLESSPVHHQPHHSLWPPPGVSHTFPLLQAATFPPCADAHWAFTLGWALNSTLPSTLLGTSFSSVQ